LILQDTSILEFETHPFHLHGYSVYIVGKGYGNYDPATSPASFNLINPPLRNTYGVPSGGWLALRFVADNPGTHYLLTVASISSSSMIFLCKIYLSIEFVLALRYYPLMFAEAGGVCDHGIAGVWLLHCHLEIHTSWGMETAFFVREGNAQDQSLPSPPRDYPRC
jgi:laccase